MVYKYASEACSSGIGILSDFMRRSIATWWYQNRKQFEHSRVLAQCMIWYAAMP